MRGHVHLSKLTIANHGRICLLEDVLYPPVWQVLCWLSPSGPARWCNAPLLQISRHQHWCRMEMIFTTFPSPPHPQFRICHIGKQRPECTSTSARAYTSAPVDAFTTFSIKLNMYIPGFAPAGRGRRWRAGGRAWRRLR